MYMSSDVVRFVLDYLFIGRINEELDQQTSLWNNHGLRTVKGNRSPAVLLEAHASKSYAKPVTEDQLREGLNNTDIDHVFGEPIPAAVILEPPVHVFDERQLLLFKQQVRPLTLADDSAASFVEKMNGALQVAIDIKQ